MVKVRPVREDFKSMMMDRDVLNNLKSPSLAAGAGFSGSGTTLFPEELELDTPWQIFTGHDTLHSRLPLSSPPGNLSFFPICSPTRDHDPLPRSFPL